MFSPTGAGQSIAVFDKSGKAVSTGKHILGVLKEAKAAYLARKAEISAARDPLSRNPPAPRIRRAQTVGDVSSVTSSHRSNRSRHVPRELRRGDESQEHQHGAERRRSDSHNSHDIHRSRPKESRSKAPKSEISLSRSMSSRTPTTPRPLPLTKDSLSSLETASQEESPRTTGQLISPRRTRSSDMIDMDLAYGEPPPNLMMTGRGPDDLELNGLVGKASFLIDEAKCVKHSVQSIITHLQKNPEAMAAVALTLGEISTLVKRMSPGALGQIRVAAPSVFALLTSPQFLIAAGVGAGITVIAFGGYKIIKKMQAKKLEEETPEQMIALSSEVSRVESWRQGVADIELRSVGTSVDGEIITPAAARLSKLNLAEDKAESHRKSGPRSVSSSGSKTVKSSRSRISRGTTLQDTSSDLTKSLSSARKHRTREGKDREAKPKPKPSPLRSLFEP